MKIAKTRGYVITIMAVAALVGGAVYIANVISGSDNIAYAYTSTLNPVDPTTAPDSYVISIPDANLRAALNTAIANTAPTTTRAPGQVITAGDARRVVDASGTRTLASKNITNLEGAQFLINAHTVYIHNNQITNVAPIGELPKLVVLQANANQLTGAGFAAMRNAPLLQNMMTAGNRVSNLNAIFAQGGFPSIIRNSTFSGQLHTITPTTTVVPNPIRGINGEAVQVVETANIKNANADGTLNPNGDHIRFVNLYGTGQVTTTWSRNFTWNTITDRPFSGTLTINYNLPPQDTQPPTFNPVAPTKIISRKGVAITITDVTATDNVALNAAGITNNAAAIGLSPADPAAGNYVLQYSATDTSDNTATVNRDIEITDADALQARVNDVTPAMLAGMTADSVAEVNAKKQAAEAVIANNASSQAAINQALAELNTTITGLRADKTPLTQAIADEAAQPAEIRNHPAVIAALAAANETNNAANPSVADVLARAQTLRDAITAAIAAQNGPQQPTTPVTPGGQHQDEKPKGARGLLATTGGSVTVAIVGAVVTTGAGALLLIKKWRSARS